MDPLVKLEYGDVVQVTDGEHKGRTGAVVGMNDSANPSVFTIEFGDGSDAEQQAESLEKEEDDFTGD